MFLARTNSRSVSRAFSRCGYRCQDIARLTPDDASPDRYAACRRRTPAASAHSAINAAWPNCGASVGYPARNRATTLFSIAFISIILCEVYVHLPADVDKAPRHPLPHLKLRPRSDCGALARTRGATGESLACT